jgi:hypothetical protein
LVNDRARVVLSNVCKTATACGYPIVRSVAFGARGSSVPRDGGTRRTAAVLSEYTWIQYVKRRSVLTC